MRFALIDDHKMVREGFKRLIELSEDHHVIFESDCYEHAVNEFSKHQRIDIAIIDISLSNRNGIELLKFCSSNFSETKCIVVSMYDSNPYVCNAMDAGAWGYVSKRSAADELLEGINSIIKGKIYLSLDVLNKLNTNKNDIGTAELQQLTARELTILPLLAKGLNAKNISQVLGIMPKTAHVHRASINRKLGVSNHFELLKIALNTGLVNIDELTK
jgi:two-component system uhpT operon response regulator UhpA